MKTNLRAALAELIGTFTLVFIGAGAGAMGTAIGGVLGVALAHGVALTVIIYALGSISGAHVNPAVTFGLAITGRIGWVKAIYYWVAQLLGASLAAFVLLYLVPGQIKGTATVGTLTASDPVKTMVVEAILAFFLMIAVYGSAVAGRNGNAVGLAIGLVLTMDILMGGPLTGASMNPARTLGPALATNDLSYLVWYLVGPLAGAGVGALFYNQLFMGKVTDASNQEAR